MKKDEYIISKDWFRNLLFDLSLYLVLIPSIGYIIYEIKAPIEQIFYAIIYLVSLYYISRQRFNYWKNNKPQLILNKVEIRILQKNKPERSHKWKNIYAELNSNVVFNNGMKYKTLKIFPKKPH